MKIIEHSLNIEKYIFMAVWWENVFYLPFHKMTSLTLIELASFYIVAKLKPTVYLFQSRKSLQDDKSFQISPKWVEAPS